MKYGNKHTVIDGKKFPSKLEAAVYLYLKTSPNVKNLETQKRVYLLRKPDIYYIADFVYELNGVLTHGEAKGFDTDTWKLKKKLWAHFGLTPLQIYKGNSKKIYLDETITPHATIKGNEVT